MQLDQLADSHLRNLIQRARYWTQLDAEFKRHLPAQLHQYLRVVCVESGTLIVHSTSPMAAARCKMLLPSLLSQLRAFNTHIQDIKIKVRPKTPESKPAKNFHIGPRALLAFEQTAYRIHHQHPELAAAINRLVKNHK